MCDRVGNEGGTTRPLPQPSELEAEALFSERVDWPDATRDYVHGLEAQIAKLQADGDKLAGAGMDAMALLNRIRIEPAGPYAINNAVALSDEFQAFDKALTEWKDRA